MKPPHTIRPGPAQKPPPREPDDWGSQVLSRKHLKFGWWALLVYLTLGIVLEGLHAFKQPYYLDVGNQARRLLWTLAHAHGTLLSLVNLAFAHSVLRLNSWPEAPRRLAGGCLIGSTVALPGGFFAGGIKIYHGDPGVGILLVPVGAVLLLAGVALTARACTKQP